MPGSDVADVQVHPHASGWGALPAGSLTDPNRPEESGQYGAEKQEEDIDAYAQ